MSFINLPPGAKLKPTNFEAHVKDEQISKFKQLLQLSELGPQTYENTTDEKYMGVTYEWMENAKKTWEETYDWRKTEDKINSYPNYTVDIKDDDNEVYTVHFIALFSDKSDAIPIVFLHGWPGSFLEFLSLLDIVKSQYPSASDLPYHIVVPSLPGYGYSSSASLKKDTSKQDTARVIDKLMVGLGFGHGYVAQGGDIGSYLSRILAAQFPSCKAAHLNMCITAPFDDVPDTDIDDVEKEGLKRYREFGVTGNAYAREHGTRPATIGFVLSSSPLALLAWIAEKFLTWSDPHSTPSLTTILDSVTLYWHTKSFPRGIYPYRALGQDVHRDVRIEKPKVFGYSYFPMDLAPTPRAWIERTGNLVWYRRHEKGGHFAALEEPEILWRDVQDFVGVGWK